MKIGIIVGSNRNESQSERTAGVLSELLTSQHEGTEVDLFLLKDLDVPLWTEDKWSSDSEMVAQWQPISERLSACDGFIVITPEWAGMATPHLKNFLLMCDAGELAHKPALLVAVSAGINGAYPIAELRMSGYKNNYIWWMPDHIIVRNVQSLFVDEDEVSVSLKNRMGYCLNFLVKTVVRIGSVREECQDLERYPYGM